ncbi:pterin cluster protein [Haloarcula marina]|uniref:pterin cluster protein n=1 Tax=Haloarcula marina TaxID=2961574 RepID=UPI0020B766A6|nr:pterin cluster protein [Halomicroarcula marina]
MSGTTQTAAERTQTTVEVHCTGHVRGVVGEPYVEFTFEGTTLRAFLDAFCARYDVADLLIAETESDAATTGWAPELESLPGTWEKNPEGDQTRCYARVTVDGQFNECLAGLDTELDGGERIGLLYPFIFCC